MWRSPVAEIDAVRKRLGWTFRWVSCGGNGFNQDYGTAFTAEQVAAGSAHYNYEPLAKLYPDLPGFSVFARGADGSVFHTYSTYARGTELVFTPFAFLDMTPKGRNEGDGIMSWLRLHDEYETSAAKACCHGIAAAE